VLDADRSNARGLSDEVDSRRNSTDQHGKRRSFSHDLLERDRRTQDTEASTVFVVAARVTREAGTPARGRLSVNKVVCRDLVNPVFLDRDVPP